MHLGFFQNYMGIIKWILMVNGTLVMETYHGSTGGEVFTWNYRKYRDVLHLLLLGEISQKSQERQLVIPSLKNIWQH